MTTSAVAGPDAEPDADPEPDAASGPDAASVAPARARRGTRRRPAGTVACWLFVGLWVLFALVRWLGFDGAVWPLVVVPAMTPYLAVGALLPLAAALLARRWLAALVAVGVLAGMAALVLPRTTGHPDAVPGPTVRVMTANLNEGQADPASVVALVRDNQVDVLALEELTEEERQALDDAGLSGLLPNAETNPRPTAGGTGIYSRYPLSDAKRIRIIQGFTETTATVHVPGALPVTVTAIHYCAPADPTQMFCWQYGKQRIPPATPHGAVRLLLGDFNMTLDYAAYRNVLATGYRDAASVLGEGLVPTWPYNGLPFPKVTIDHVVPDQRIGVSALAAHTVRDSDHRALTAVLTFPKD
jgi:endonuclease/exonuclease/phosphatase family metal-dependent hydrolase